MINVEEEFGKVVVEVGGNYAQDLCGKSPNFSNADFIFDEQKVIAEMKCLVKDQVADEATIEQLTKVYQEALDRGETKTIIYGQSSVRLGDFEEEVMLRMAEVLRRPMQRIITKANKQIKQTKQHMDRGQHLGLLILVNDSYASLDPQSLLWMVDATLGDRAYSSINSVLFFSPNLAATDGRTERKIVPWIVCTREGFEHCCETLLDSLRDAWMNHHALITSEPVSFRQSPPDQIQALRNLT